MATVFIRFKEGCRRLGLGNSTGWYKNKHDDEFPKVVRIDGVSGFIESELEEYLQKKIAQFRVGGEIKPSLVKANEKRIKTKQTENRREADNETSS